MTDQMLQDLHDHVRNRFYGKYRGVVVNVDAATMRVQASVPAALPNATSGWAMPCVPYAGPQVGFMMLPEIGSGVWIEFEGGDVSYPVWTGCYWNAGEIPSTAASTLKTIVTTAGSLAFDNQANTVTLADAAQDTVVLNGSSVTTTAGAASIAAGPASVSINNGALEVT
jgi:uncharacterized protein involved in type VI secretion and phage assembly